MHGTLPRENRSPSPPSRTGAQRLPSLMDANRRAPRCGGAAAAGACGTLSSMRVRGDGVELHVEDFGGGGEPLLQAEFVNALFAKCKELGIHTALDTGGFFAQAELDKVLPNTDLIMFSLKAADEDVHRRLTGKDNALILQNLFYAASRTQLILRYVVIPSVNDSENALAKLADVLKKLPANVKIDLLPYHSMGKAKWQMLEIPYKLNSVPDATKNDIQRVKNFFIKAGINNDYVG